ncbi:DUF4349 domain-containing protein [Haladaptatus sp. CMAA 1911]|uniref:DUF4349 domain-containing protein n=1 Tax=unclassified Haladaptatus TaxID=2622732 RepID=UPI003754D0FF
MTTRTRKLAVLSLVLLVALAGCSGMGGDDAAKENGNYDTGRSDGGGSGGGNAGDGQADGGSPAQSALVVQQRMLIRTGDLSLSVESFDNASRVLTEFASERGGFVSDSSQRVHRRGNDTWTTGKVVFRIPKDDFSAFFERAKQAGEVQESNTGTEDVTDQLVDLKARLDNLQSQRDKLRALYENASDTEDVLAVQKRLSAVQSDIERLEAKQQSLEGRVAYSTVTVRMQEPQPDSEAETPAEKSWYDTGVVSAFLDSVDGVVVMLRAFVVGIAYLLPYLAVLGIPVGAVLLVRRRSKSNASSVTHVTEADENEAADVDEKANVDEETDE